MDKFVLIRLKQEKTGQFRQFILKSQGDGMRRFLIVLSLILTITGCYAPTPQIKPITQSFNFTDTMPVRDSSSLVKHIGGSTVALMAVEEGHSHVYCTGVWVSSSMILTANHCAEAGAAYSRGDDPDLNDKVNALGSEMKFIMENEVIGINEEPQTLHLGTVRATDKLHDLALIQAYMPGRHEVAQIASIMPAIGERIYIVGQVKGFYWSYVEGLVSNYRHELRGLRVPFQGPFVQVSAPIYFGNSGGGVFDQEGNLIGIASFITNTPNMAFFIHAESIKRFLNKSK